MNKLCFYILLIINVGFISCSEQKENMIGFRSADDLALFGRGMYDSRMMPWKNNEFLSDMIQTAVVDLELLEERSEYFHNNFIFTSLKPSLLGIYNNKDVSVDILLASFEKYLKKEKAPKKSQFVFAVCAHAIIIKNCNVKDTTSE